MAGTKGNLGRIRHGLRAGSLPPGCSYIKRSIAEFRKSLEATVLDARQEIDLVSAATIQTYCRWERHGLLAQKWLRENPDLSVSEKLAFSREIAKASTERDR